MNLIRSDPIKIPFFWRVLQPGAPLQKGDWYLWGQQWCEATIRAGQNYAAEPYTYIRRFWK